MRINLDGKILSALTRIFDTLMATVMFLLCCLPVFTIGASVSAMYATMIRIAGDGCSSTTGYFFGAFRDNFKQATILWLTAALVGLVVATDIVVCWGFEMNATLILAIMQGLTIFCTCLYLAVSIYLFAGIAVYRVTWKQAFANAIQWTMKKLPATGGLVLLSIGMAVSVLILWYFAFPVIAIGLYLQGKILLRVFELEEPEVHVDEEINY